MRNILFVLILLPIFGLKAQQKGKITYELVVTKNPDGKKKKNSEQFQLNTEENALLLNKMEIEVFFDEENSYFPAIMGYDDNNAMAAFGLKKDIFVSNREKASFLPTDYNGEKVLRRKGNYDWKIHSETKKIGKYLVHKATAKYYNKELIAWYASEFPYSYGPVGFFGLPGLILEIGVKEELLYAYRFKKLRFSKKNQVKKAPNLRVVSSEEMNKYYIEYYKNLKLNYQNLIEESKE